MNVMHLMTHFVAVEMDLNGEAQVHLKRAACCGGGEIVRSVGQQWWYGMDNWIEIIDFQHKGGRRSLPGSFELVEGMLRFPLKWEVSDNW